MSRSRHMPQGDYDLAALSERYLNAIIKGDLKGATKLIVSSFEQGIEAMTLYLSVVCPAQRRLGELWSDKVISITEEHIATQISLSVISVLRERVTPKNALGVKCLVTTPLQDPHIFPAKVVADLFFFDGWEVIFPGNEIPHADLLSFVERLKIDLVAISVTLPPSDSFRDLLSQIKELPNSPKILVGGAGAAVLTGLPEIDAVASSLPEALVLAQNLVRSTVQEDSLDLVLQKLGEKIYQVRKERILNQNQLATLSGLDRAYLSAVENGKQNVSLGAVHKIASALGVQVSELLNPE